MGLKSGKQYTPKFKFTVVLEALKSEKSNAEVARRYGVHPVTVSRWKKQFLEKGAEVSGGSEEEVKELGPDRPARVVTFEFPKLAWSEQPFRPSHFFDIGDEMETKLEAIRTYRTMLREPSTSGAPKISDSSHLCVGAKSASNIRICGSIQRAALDLPPCFPTLTAHPLFK